MSNNLKRSNKSVGFAVPEEFKKKPRNIVSDSQAASNMHKILVDQKNLHATGIDEFQQRCDDELKALGGWNSSVIDFTKTLNPFKLTQKFSLPESDTKVSVLDDVIPAEWCTEFITLHEKVGFRSAPLAFHEQYYDSATREKITKNTSQMVQVSSIELGQWLWERIGEHIPPRVYSSSKFTGGWYEKVNVLPVFRFLRYRPGQGFKPHHDPSRISVEFQGQTGVFKSMTTLAFYLNDATDFEGGELNFVKLQVQPIRYESQATVRPCTGRCAIFRHDELHEGGGVSNGSKYMMQCDVMYRREDGLLPK